jgi:dTDP-4-amino-4,6-dideoxygalactose transaminase
MKKPDQPLKVTVPYLPPLDEVYHSLEEIWSNKWITNNGPFHQEFEKKLADFLGVKYLSLFNNGTLALITALQTLRISGEVITTPYSFVATTHALHWNGIKPVFCDIEPHNMNINPEKVISAITPRTTAILPVHVYGHPCDVETLQKIADTYGLKIIYDAAHAFNVKYKNESVLEYGDLSVLSFHGTKIFTTFEGGAIICHDEKTKRRIDFLKNFGFADETTVVAPGINAKMNEFQAALGLLQLKYIEKVIEERKSLIMLYRNLLKDLTGVRYIIEDENVTYNFAYFPVFIDELKFGKKRDDLYDYLKSCNIYGRRYFYPLISHFPSYRGLESAEPGNLPVAEKMTRQVICLPVFPGMTKQNVEYVVEMIKAYQINP